MNLLRARRLLGNKNIVVSLVFSAMFALMTGEALAKPRHSIRKHQQACGTTYDKAKETFEANHLMEAKALLEKCIRAMCGSLVHDECTTLYTQLESDVPTVVPMVTDDTGTPRTRIEVRMDGEILTSKLDGLGLPVEPGTHEFSFSMGDTVFAKRRIMVAQGQHNRPISVLLRAPLRRAPSDAETLRAGVAHHEVARKPGGSIVAESETAGSTARPSKDPRRIDRHGEGDHRL
jgi:hypothetical protein